VYLFKSGEDMKSSALEMTIDIEVEFIDANGSMVIERTITDRIMPQGARILLQKKIQPASNLKIRTIDKRFQSLAIVKEIQTGQDNLPRIIIEFLGTAWKRDWLFPRDPKEQIYEELLEYSKQTYELLQNVEKNLQKKKSLDPAFLSNVKQSVDDLRKAIFSAQRTFTE
jgi:hypothetical protein